MVLTEVATTETRPMHRGKAPPVDSFTGEDAEITLDDWLSSLQRAAEWNGWVQEEKLTQLAGYASSWKGTTGVRLVVRGRQEELHSSGTSTAR